MVDFIIRFIKENPLTIVLLVMLIAFAPSLMGGMLIGVLILMGILLLLPLIMFFRLRRISRRMEQQAREAYGRAEQQSHRQKEGEVKIYTTTDRPQKRVSDDVGDYVEFEEVKNPEKR